MANDIQVREGYLEITLIDKNSASDMIDLVHRLVVCLEDEPSLPLLLDRSREDPFVETARVRRVVGELEQHAHLFRGRRCAIVAPNEILFGISRMLATLVVELMEIRVFKDPDEARSWLVESSAI